MELEIEQLADGCVRVSMGGVSCTVSSMHLVEDKRRQLEAALEAMRTAPGP